MKLSAVICAVILFISLLITSTISYNCLKSESNPQINYLCKNFEFDPTKPLTDIGKSLVLSNVTGTIYKNSLASAADLLEELTIANSSLEAIESGALSSDKSLHTLKLIDNKKLPPLDTILFPNNLKYLNLARNSIANLKPGVFKNLHNLIELDLSDNEINSLTWEEFEGLNNLKILFIERNPFVGVNTAKLLENLPGLERIFLSRREEIVEVSTELAKNNITVIITT